MISQSDLETNYPRVMLQTSGWPETAELEDTGFGTMHPVAGSALGIGAYRMIDRHFYAGYPAYTGGPASPSQLEDNLAQFPANSLHLIGAETVYDVNGVGTAAAVTTKGIGGAPGSVFIGTTPTALITEHRAFLLDQVQRFRDARPDMPAIIEMQALAQRTLFTVSNAQFAQWRPEIIASMAEFAESELGQDVDGLVTRLQWANDLRLDREDNWAVQRRQLRELGEMWREAGWTKHLGVQIWPVERERYLVNGTVVNNSGALLDRRFNRERMRMGIFEPWDRLYIWDYYQINYAPGWPTPWWADLVKIAQEAAITDGGGTWPGTGGGGSGT